VSQGLFPSETDTIVAVSTASGAGAIGIVRLSGPEAYELGSRIFRPISAAGTDVTAAESRASHRLRYGHAVDPQEGRVLDEVLVAFMRGPATYTREDVVEVHCHGGAAAQRAVLQALVRLGARPAEPGEFTKRAFLHGRLDLTQAESVAALVRARSASALRAAVNQLQGGLGEQLRELRAALVAVLAEIEVAIDFSEEDAEDLDRRRADARLARVEEALDSLLATAFLGRALEQGVRTAIAGRPNVGKSSLLNALLSRERAIVSEIPGTTRDTVEELTEVEGIPLHLVDTAGIREGGDPVERLGIERSRLAVETADLTLLVVDSTQGLLAEDRDLLADLDPARTIVVANKRDLVHAEDVVALEALLQPRWAVVALSARTGEGMGHLHSAITRLLVGEKELQLEEPLLANERQRRLVEEAREAVAAARRGIQLLQPEELVCEDLRAGVGALGRVTGEELVPDLLDQIFSRFCIGK
jgi:tRNA modification GTPase